MTDDITTRLRPRAEVEMRRAWAAELPGVELYAERDPFRFETILKARGTVRSDEHRLAEDQLGRGPQALIETIETLAAEVRERALDAFGLRSAVDDARKAERAKFDRLADQIDVLRQSAMESRRLRLDDGDLDAAGRSLSEASAFERTAAMIREVER